MTENGRLERYADLAVRSWVNMAEGQELMVFATSLAHAPLVRALARAGYRNGARYVEAYYEDQHIRRAMIELAPEETLTWSPPWLIKRVEDRAANKSALIAITGDPEPELLADLDGERVGRARPVELIKRVGELTSDQPNNWCVISYPNEGWAEIDLRRARRRAAMGGAEPCGPPGRGRPGRGLGRTRREASGPVEGAERPALRRGALSRARH